jgi:hypothetical protein
MNFALFSWPKSKPVSVTVRTFKTKKTDLERLQEAKHRQLAKELGLPWPLRASVGRRV